MMTFIARMKVKEGREDEFIELAEKLTEKVRENEPGTLYYEFFRLRDEPDGFAVFEKFVDEAAEEAHRNTPYFEELATLLVDCLDGPYVREYLDPLK